MRSRTILGRFLRALSSADFALKLFKLGFHHFWLQKFMFTYLVHFKNTRQALVHLLIYS
jgi:hypothetical protein